MKYWVATIDGYKVRANTLKELALLLDIKPSLIEGVYYRNRLSETIKIEKVTESESCNNIKIIPGKIFVSFD